MIAAAGYGSRFFPVAKTINKCMLPILDKPVIHYAVEECVRAGITQIAIVGPPGDDQIRRYFSEDAALQQHFHDRGWDQKYEPIARLHELAHFTFLEQPRDGRYGTAMPAMVAADFIGDDAVLLLSGDDLLLRGDGGHDIADLVQAYGSADVSGAIAAVTIPGFNANRYGVLVTRQTGDLLLLDGVMEKPADYAEATAHINISRAVLPRGFLRYLDELPPSSSSGEYQITDAIHRLAQERDILVHPVKGRYHDCGDPGAWLNANIAAAALAGVPTQQGTFADEVEVELDRLVIENAELRARITELGG